MTKLSDRVLNAMIEDSYEAWKSIMQNYHNVTDLLCYLETCNHLKLRLKEIRLGLEHDLTYEQIKFYARPEFDYQQMRPIRLGFVAGFTYEQIENYAHPEFSGGQMMEIYRGYSSGLTDEQIHYYANPILHEYDMEDIRWGYIINPTEQQINVQKDIILRKNLIRKSKINNLKNLIDSKN